MTISRSVVSHPYRELMAEAQREREIADTPEATALMDAIVKAVVAYGNFLERQGLVVEDSPDEWPRMKATALVITYDFFTGMDIVVKDGAIDRVYRNGTNPDPDGRGPPDIPHKRRTEPPAGFLEG